MPGSIRLFVQAPLTEGAEVAASAGQAHYLLTVMRRASGEVVRVFNGLDGEWEARIAAVGRGRALLVADRRTRPQVAEPDLWLAFAALKRDATDLVVQKATELGVSTIVPVLTARTQTGRVNASPAARHRNGSSRAVRAADGSAYPAAAEACHDC